MIPVPLSERELPWESIKKEMFNASNPPTRLRNQLVRFNQHGWITRIIKPYVLIAPPGHAAAEMLKRNSCSSLGCHGGLLGILWGVPPVPHSWGSPAAFPPFAAVGWGRDTPNVKPQPLGVRRQDVGCTAVAGWGAHIGGSWWDPRVGVFKLGCPH